MADKATWHIFLLKNVSGDFDIRTLLDAILQAEGSADVFELRLVNRAEYTKPTPLYYARTKTALIKRNEVGKAIGSVDRNIQLPVYEEHKDFGNMKDRAVITPSGIATEHVWMGGLERVT